MLIEHLRTTSITADGHGPDEVATWATNKLLMASIEIEEDRRAVDEGFGENRNRR